MSLEDSDVHFLIEMIVYVTSLQNSRQSVTTCYYSVFTNKHLNGNGWN